MTIIVEDGTIVSGANSYISEAELTTYATARGVTISGDTEELLIKAMDYIEGLNYKGIKRTEAQGLVWPRVDVIIDTYLFASDEIPQQLKDGLAEAALASDNGNDQLSDIARVQDRAQVGPVSVEYAKGTNSTTNVRKINNKLQKVLRTSANGYAFPVVKG